MLSTFNPALRPILGTAMPTVPCVSLALASSLLLSTRLTFGEALPPLPVQGVGGCLPHAGSGIGD